MMVILVRHAERQPSGTDPGLSAAGKRRALLLATMLAEAGVTAIFTSGARRTKETAAPLAAKVSVASRIIDDDTAKARMQILGGGDVVVVVGHSDTVPEFIGALGGPSDLEIDDAEFDRMFVLRVPDPAPVAAPAPAPAPASLLAMRYVSV
jgi:broad specificity phosphatase PhoE